MAGKTKVPVRGVGAIIASLGGVAREEEEDVVSCGGSVASSRAA